MKKVFNITLFALALSFVPSSHAAEESVVGKWKGQFDSQIGIQKYTFEFKVDGDKLTGKAVAEREMGTNEVQLTEGKINKDEISFVENLHFGDNDIRIEYTGKISGDEIKFHRKVADIATEDFVAKRVKDGSDKSDVKPGKASEPAAATNAPAAKP
jgi:hypothetical protein